MNEFKHDGGPCPIDGSEVIQVRFRNGLISKPLEASKWRWQWGGRFGRDNPFDIISFKSSKLENSKGAWKPISGGYE